MSRRASARANPNRNPDNNNDTRNEHVKTIKLKEFHPDTFHSWRRSAELTFKVYKIWPIVDGTEPRPTAANTVQVAQ